VVVSVFGYGVVTYYWGWAGSAPSFAKDGSNPSAQQQQEQRQPTPLRISNKDIKKLIVKKVQPEYPQSAGTPRGLIVDTCGVRVVITPQGELSQVGLIFGHPVLAPSAIAAVKRWKFRPYVLQGQAVEVEGEVDVEVHP
jgi:protein TonB